jgi:hypothetical protein
MTKLRHVAPERQIPPEPDARDNENECTDRALAVARVLERCEEELGRLEAIPAIGAARVNAVSMAKGFVERARTALEKVA